METPSTPSSPALSAFSDFPARDHVPDGPESAISSPYSDPSEAGEMGEVTQNGVFLSHAPRQLSSFRQQQLMELQRPEYPSPNSSTEPLDLPGGSALDGLGTPLSSQNEKSAVVFYSSASESESQQSPSRLKAARRRKIDESVTPSAKAKRPPRRKSRAMSEAASEKSHKSEYQGGGYTSTPATGKIFRNLLILEESLRHQVIQQRTLRRKYLTFLSGLCSLIASISYHLYFSELSSGPLRVCLQLVLLMLVVTLLLYHLSGEYQKTIVLPRKFLSSTNKGLRQLNVRLVRTKSSMTGRTADLLRELGLFLCVMALKFCHAIAPSMSRNPRSRLEVWLVSVQSRCQPRFGLNDIKLVLAPRSFNTDIREGWELYRDEFWIKEGMRRRNRLLDFTRVAESAEKRASSKGKRGEKGDKEKEKEKEKRKRKLSVGAAKAGLSEQNLGELQSLALPASGEKPTTPERTPEGSPAQTPRPI